MSAVESEQPVPETPSHWGTFLQPDPRFTDVKDLHEVLGIELLSRHRADLPRFLGAHPVLDDIIAAIAAADVVYEDLCSTQHYFDVFECVDLFRGNRTSGAHTQRIVDLGVYMGGTATLFAGCVEPWDLQLDLVDINETFLQFCYERLRRTFPESSDRVRLFYGDFPTYVKRVLLAEDGVRTLVHHDGAHDFNQVIRDLASLYFVRDRVEAIAIQDTHLRSATVELFDFVDAAVFAVFGRDVSYGALGYSHQADSPSLSPNQYQGQYFLEGAPEGMYIPLARNRFLYPHPSMSLEQFLPPWARDAG